MGCNIFIEMSYVKEIVRCQNLVIQNIKISTKIITVKNNLPCFILLYFITCFILLMANLSRDHFIMEIHTLSCFLTQVIQTAKFAVRPEDVPGALFDIMCALWSCNTFMCANSVQKPIYVRTWLAQLVYCAHCVHQVCVSRLKIV